MASDAPELIAGMREIRWYYLISISLFFQFSNACYGQSFDYKENSVYLYNFIKYTNWAQKKTTIQIGIVGNSPIEEELGNLIAKKKNGPVSYLLKHINATDAKNMDVLIITQSSSNELKAIDKLTAHLPILIVTEKANLARFGACISFYIDEDNDYKTGYQLSIRNCKSRGLNVNEQILNNAELIR